MSEAAIISSMFSIWDRYWTVIQWWASVSFSLIVVAHFAAAKIDKVLITLMIILYSLYTVWVSLLAVDNFYVADGLERDLIALRESGLLTSQGAAELIDDGVRHIGFLVSAVAVTGTFFTSVGYLIYAHRRGDNEEG